MRLATRQADAQQLLSGNPSLTGLWEVDLRQLPTPAIPPASSTHAIPTLKRSIASIAPDAISADGHCSVVHAGTARGVPLPTGGGKERERSRD